MTCPPVWSATTGVEDGRHIVVVHGTLDRAAGLLKLSRRLDDRYRVTRYDRRGYGRSRPCDGPFDMAAQVEDLIALIEQTGQSDDEERVIVGHSYGGNVALALADRRPDLVSTVVTYESPLSWTEWWPSNSAGGDAVAWRADPEEAAERFMRRLIGDARWERLPPSSRSARRAEGPAMVGELIDLRTSAPWTPERIEVPVLAVRGEHGAEHHREGAQRLADMLPDAEMATIAGARHFGPNTHPDDMAELIDDFTTRVRRRSATGS